MAKQISSTAGVVFFASLICLSSLCNAQTSNVPMANGITDSTLLVWLKDLYQSGVKVDGDSFFVNKESERLISDKAYRQLIYPSTYTWEAAKGFIQSQEIKKAVWFLINLYLVNDKNKELVVKSILVYDKLFKMDKILVSSFYTYSLTDPEVGTIEDGNSKITAPHVMEKKLNALKAMLFYLDKYKPADRIEDSLQSGK